MTIQKIPTPFTDWAKTIADSADADDFRSRVSDSENASMWQSLSFKANVKVVDSGIRGR